MLEAALYEVALDGSIRMLGRTTDAAAVEAVRVRVAERERRRLMGLALSPTAPPTQGEEGD